MNPLSNARSTARVSITSTLPGKPVSAAGSRTESGRSSESFPTSLSEAQDALGMVGLKTRLAGLQLHLPGESEHEWQVAFEALVEKMAVGSKQPDAVADLVRREGQRLLIHTTPYLGQTLLEHAIERDERMGARLVEAAAPEMRELMAACLDQLAQEWDRTVARFGQTDAPLPISLQGFASAAEGQVDRDTFDGWFRGILDSQRPFVVAERHTNAGATHFLTDNMPHWAGCTLFTEAIETEIQPLIDEFLNDPHAELHPLIASHRMDAREMLYAAKVHGVAVIGINSLFASEYKLPGDLDFHRRGRAMNQVAHDIITSHVPARSPRGDGGPVTTQRYIIHCGTGHGKFGKADDAKPPIHGVGAVLGCPTLLFEESPGMEALTDRFCITRREFDTNRLMNPNAPGSVATNKYDLRIWKMAGSWKVVSQADAASDSDVSEDALDDVDAEASIDYENDPRYEYNDRLDEWVMKARSDDTDESEEESDSR